MTKKSKALAKRHVKKPSAALAKPTLGQVVDEVQQQRADLRRMMQASSLAAAFCAELAGMLKMPFSGTPEDYDELRSVLAIQLAQVEHATELDHFFGQLNMAYGAAGHINQNDVVDAVRCYRNLANELLLNGQELVDKVRELKLKA